MGTRKEGCEGAFAALHPLVKYLLSKEQNDVNGSFLLQAKLTGECTLLKN